MRSVFWIKLQIRLWDSNIEPAENVLMPKADSAGSAEVQPLPKENVRINRRPIIYLSVNVIKVPWINTVEQLFTCEFAVRGWTSGLKGARIWLADGVEPPGDQDDPRWSGEGDHRELSRPLMLEEYDPRLTALNMVGACETWRFSSKWMGAVGGEMEFKWRIGGTFIEAFEIERFPRGVRC